MSFAITKVTNIEALELCVLLRADPACVLLLGLLWCVPVILWLNKTDPVLVLASSALASDEVSLLRLNVSSNLIQTFNVGLLPHPLN